MNSRNKKLLGIAITLIALISLSGMTYAATADQVVNPAATADNQQITNPTTDSQQSTTDQAPPIDPNSKKKNKGSGGPKFYSDKSTYKYNSQILFILENDGAKTIWVPNIFKSKWQIVNQKTHEIIYLPLEDCTDQYGNCGDDFTRLELGQKILQSWDQFNNDDEHVPPGTYMASATFRYNNPSPNTVLKVYTKTFKIKKP